MSLSNIYQALHDQAERSGEDRAVNLRGGARLAVRAKDGVTTLTIQRKGKKLSTTELVTFKRDCGIPGEAARYPHEDQAHRTAEDGAVFFYVAYRWSDAAAPTPAGQVTEAVTGRA